MNITPAQYSYSPQFNGKIKLMNSKEMSDFIKKVPRDTIKMEEFVYKNKDEAINFMYSKLVTGNRNMVNKILSCLGIGEISDAQLLKLQNDLKEIGKKFNKIV